jgi:hypothetical protein
MKIDDWFKPFVAVAITILLVICYLYSQNGRYIFRYSGDEIYIVDSRTGTLYGIKGETSYKFEVPLGKSTFSTTNRIDRRNK